MANSIISAMFTDFFTVRIRTARKVPDSSVFCVLTASGERVPIAVSREDKSEQVCALNCAVDSVAVGKTEFDIVLAAEVDFTQQYTLSDDSGFFAAAPISKYKLFDTDEFQNRYNYDGELGADYSAKRTVFTVWSPFATKMLLNIYDAGECGKATEYPMTKGTKGEWTVTVDGNLDKKYYTYKIVDATGNAEEVVDPYARSGGKNGKRGMILDLDSTNPDGWDTQNIPQLKGNTHAVIWEAHVRDVTIHESSGVSEAHRGKFLGLTETGTENGNGKPTALDYIKELGVTAVHFQPLFDFATVDESFIKATYNKAGEFNWGYDPLNYNMPEGSYSTDPSKGEVRVNELKQMIMALHNAGVQVVMDVVYNHVNNAASSNFEKLMPEYFFRKTDKGALSNGSGCGNETASERFMFRRFMIDSVKYWMTEYKIDGFRFDLMALHDTATMNSIYNALSEINPDVIIYGEGWKAGDSPLPESQQSTLANAKCTPNIAYFDDVIRNALRGDNFDKAGKGYVQGVNGLEDKVYVGVYGATNNFALGANQNINYVCAHDDSTLWDRLNASVNWNKSTLKAMNRLAAASVFTSQGVAFILAGEEMLRSKPTTENNPYDNRPVPYKSNPKYFFSDNSYRSPDSVNAIDWNLLDENADIIEYYKVLIAIKKAWPQFHLATKQQIDRCVFVPDNNKGDGIISYAIKDPDSDEYAVVLLNNSDKTTNVSVPKGEYAVYINGDKASATEKLSEFSGSSFTVGARSAVVMKGELSQSSVIDWKSNAHCLSDDPVNLGVALDLGIGVPTAAIIADGEVFGAGRGNENKSE
ncbi:MAG: type I pullulanase [Clostridiales bacterium]|nr:type I pullulanase [Clostridiales bacterium]